ncbi:hypothetical protein [Acetobacter oeni]|uniref:Uncharacterized protein n=1 Tax=Acetobacter oeni TaxID=304077 RepID=A0A511XKY1_9PROT|nr:hypothetical protein [Acetobacter oeni]MBB3883822.1 hypothetical protein [Acetobacter oeni]NHO19837.1 hypothetical protein [Acetobacter oeni]GBR10506.1 hypothetical protein AA21952_3096 [Acetobacter oeni LMG 21952]GEN63574.1 hypothetical protein AOE01nite_17980 [Acetobacter oeni]
MATEERIIFQSYTWKKGGRRPKLDPGSPIVCRNEEDGLRRLEKVRLGQLSVDGAQVVRMSVDVETGDYGEPEYLGAAGDVPDAEGE